MSDFVIYPAIFHNEEGTDGYWVKFPDIEGCVTEGDTLEHAMQMAQEALGLYLDDVETYPKSSDIRKIEHNELVFPVMVDMKLYHKKYVSKSIKKTLSIPEWLNQEAEKANINFSRTLQEALVKKLEL